ncbi:MAG: hypothetical protein ACP6IU_15030 [Candidatus Asgardarchaeia archaeon]
MSGIIWKESRSAAANVVILGFIIFLGILTISFVAGLYGIAWLNIAKMLGFQGSVEDAMKAFGNPQSLIDWFAAWWDWFWGEVYKFLQWLYEQLFGKKSGSHGSWGSVILEVIRFVRSIYWH